MTVDLWLTLVRDRDSAAVWQHRVDGVADVLDVAPARARGLLHVGDLRREDVLGAGACGMRTAR